MINIKIQSITSAVTDAVVNAANPFLMPGGGVCGALFEAAGYEQLRQACEAIGSCETGKAVVTPGFNLKAKYIIHAVGPKWEGGNQDEAKLLASTYRKALHQARVNKCESVSFPLISAGIYGYPVREAWEIALHAVSEYLSKHPEFKCDVTFCVLDSDIVSIGNEILARIDTPAQTAESKTEPKKVKEKESGNIILFLLPEGPHGFLSNWYRAPFTVEGIKYVHIEQYMMAKKALLFKDIEHYFLIMNTEDPEACKHYGRQVANFDHAVWADCRCEVVYNALYAKFCQNKDLREALIATGNAVLAEANPHDKLWGIALSADDPKAPDSKHWQGENQLGKLLERVREALK